MGGAPQKQIDIVEKIRISYELISKKGAQGPRGGHSPPAGVITTAG
jgi:hypothetical protein